MCNLQKQKKIGKKILILAFVHTFVIVLFFPFLAHYALRQKRYAIFEFGQIVQIPFFKMSSNNTYF